MHRMKITNRKTTQWMSTNVYKTKWNAARKSGVLAVKVKKPAEEKPFLAETHQKSVSVDVQPGHRHCTVLHFILRTNSQLNWLLQLEQPNLYSWTDYYSYNSQTFNLWGNTAAPPCMFETPFFTHLAHEEGHLILVPPLTLLSGWQVHLGEPAGSSDPSRSEAPAATAGRSREVTSLISAHSSNVESHRSVKEALYLNHFPADCFKANTKGKQELPESVTILKSPSWADVSS